MLLRLLTVMLTDFSVVVALTAANFTNGFLGQTDDALWRHDRFGKRESVFTLIV
jgi:hypothetical protein